MVELFLVNPTDGRRGIVLHPTKCEVSYDAGGRYDFEMTLPLMRDGFLVKEEEYIGYGEVIKCSVPPQHIPEISLGPVYAWRVKSGQTADLMKNLGYTQRISYQAWSPGRSYMAGDRVTADGQNWQCTTGHGGITTPPAQNPTLWTTIANYTEVAGTVLETLSAGTQFIKLGDYNTTYMRAQHGNNIGFIEISKCEYVSVQGEQTIPARDITTQLFRVTEIEKNSNNGTMTVHGVHISYLLNGILLDECDLVQASPQMALAAIYGAMMDDWNGTFATSITAGKITDDYTNRMAGDVLLNPSNGFLQAVDGRLIRDNRDIVIVPNNDNYTPVYELSYGVNLLGVRWTVNIDEMVTRVYPVAKDDDDSTLWLPTKYIESLYGHDWAVSELLDTGLKVGETEKKSDGTEATLTKNEVLSRMASMAQDRFDRDHCDMPIITLDVDFIHIGNTEEYKQYKGLATVAPYEWVLITHPPLDLEVTTQLIGYTWDAINDKYTKTKFGDVRQHSGRSVTDWDLRDGAVTKRALSARLKRTLNI